MIKTVSPHPRKLDITRLAAIPNYFLSPLVSILIYAQVGTYGSDCRPFQRGCRLLGPKADEAVHKNSEPLDRCSHASVVGKSME